MSWTLVDPREAANKGDSVLVYEPTGKGEMELKALSKVWRAIPTWKCMVCSGFGHIEAECSTKKTLDQYAKTCEKE